MAKEIERKFLVNKDLYVGPRTAGFPVKGITQGYLFDIKRHVGRIRITSDRKAIFTYKGPTEGISRVEVEFQVPFFVGKLLQKLCRKVIHKTRTKIPATGIDSAFWEIDQFHNLGRELLLAEIELPSEDTTFDKPDWLGQEVSTDPFYYNSNIVNMVTR